MTVAAVTRHLEDVCYQPSDRESKDISGNYVTGDKLNKLACTRGKCEQNAQKRNEDPVSYTHLTLPTIYSV